MKKIILSVIFAAFISAGAASGCYAKSKVAESPDIKIVIDSNQKKVENVPIIVNDRTMLPLREIATQLGVSNDDEHIKWDPAQKTVYLAKDNTTISLKIDDKKAKVNGENVEMDVPPVIYSNRTYIPVRFVSQSFGKKVVWDSSTKSVLICEDESYQKVKALLDKSNAAMSAIKKGKMKLTMDMTVAGDDNKNTSIAKVTMDSLFDNEQKKSSVNFEMNMFTIMSIKMQTYMADNVIYSKSSFSEEWEKETLSDEEFNKEFESSRGTNATSKNDIISAGMIIGESENPDEVVLTGDIILKDIADNASSGGEESSSMDGVDDFRMSIVLDKNTYFLKEITMSFTGDLGDEDNEISVGLFSTSTYKADIKCIYSDLNGNFEVVKPEDLDITKAVEKSSESSFVDNFEYNL